MTKLEPALEWCGIVGIFAFSTVLIFLISFFAALPAEPYPRNTVNKENYNTIRTLNRYTEAEWLEVLRTAPIKQIVNEDLVGLATKYVVVFETGHIAIAKLIEPFRLFPLEWDHVDFDFSNSQNIRDSSYARSGRRFQAWTEVAASAVARNGFPNIFKPPAAIRKIDSSLLYNCDGCNSWEDFFIRTFLPKHDVYISVHGYMHMLSNANPSVEVMEYLTHTPEVHTKLPIDIHVRSSSLSSNNFTSH
jgi:hypothetical protein